MKRTQLLYSIILVLQEDSCLATTLSTKTENPPALIGLKKYIISVHVAVTIFRKVAGFDIVPS